MANTHLRAEDLRAYAAGTLPPGLSLLVATHLCFCGCCREKVAGMEALCGALLASGEAVAPNRRCLSGALARLDGNSACCRETAMEGELPRPLRRWVEGPLAGLPWVRIDDGVSTAMLSGFPVGQVALVRAAPGARMAFDAGETVILLSGGLGEGAERYEPGDVVSGRAGTAAGAQPCLCLAVQRFRTR